MKLNDPFGRMERRHQVGYEALRDSLHRNKIFTEEGARKLIRDTKMRALKFVVGAGAATVVDAAATVVGAATAVVGTGSWAPKG